MPRFFFHIRHIEYRRDEEGLELPDRKAAWHEATTACGEMMRELDGQLEPGSPEWRMEVEDDAGKQLFAISFRAELRG